MTSTMYMFFLFNKIPPPISSKLFRRIWNETSWRMYTCIQLSKLQTHSRGWILVSKLTMNFQQDFQNTCLHYRNMESSCSWTKRNSLKEKFVTEKRQLEEKKVTRSIHESGMGAKSRTWILTWLNRNFDRIEIEKTSLDCIQVYWF